MARLITSAILLSVSVASGLYSSSACSRNLSPQETNSLSPIVEGAPTLAPFQHVRFCIRYPSDCKSASTGSERIELNGENSELLKRVNQSVNAAIIPTPKAHGADPEDGWTIAPAAGDCNDYAVTKRHELLRSGLPAKALRLSVVETASGIGHLVLVVATTRGDIVLDNLTEEMRPWQNTDYDWLKIQSAADARFWYQVKVRRPPTSQVDRRLRLANR
jgi:predicted transglutaminase-like cysteine proteinase